MPYDDRDRRALFKNDRKKRRQLPGLRRQYQRRGDGLLAQGLDQDLEGRSEIHEPRRQAKAAADGERRDER